MTSGWGKPAASDLASGYLTAPVLYALEERPALAGLIEREFCEAGDLDQALSLVRGCDAIARSRVSGRGIRPGGPRGHRLAAPLGARSALRALPEYVLSRLY